MPAPHDLEPQECERLLRARSLRRSPSVAERVAWKLLRKERLGFKFRRQHAVGPYVLDFYCPEAMLALEFDGEQHVPARDARRDAWLQDRGIATVRIPNREFFSIDQPRHEWLNEVVRVCEVRTGRRAFADDPPPQPSPNAIGRGG